MQDQVLVLSYMYQDYDLGDFSQEQGAGSLATIEELRTAEINTVACATDNPDITSQIGASINNELPQDQQELCLPQQYKSRVMSCYHNIMTGHLGQNRTLAAI